MKSIIDGFRFDTEKAVLIGEYASPHYATDFGSWQAGLYKTPRAGRFFLSGRGGPMTIFAKPAYGGGMTGGARIIPLTQNDAFEWACQNLSVETVEQYFSDLIKD